MKKISPQAKKLRKGIIEEYAIDDEAGLAILQTAMEAYTEMERAQVIVDEQGPVLVDRWNQVKAHPLCSVIRDCRAQFLAGLKALNLDLEPLHNKPGRPPNSKNKRW